MQYSRHMHAAAGTAEALEPFSAMRHDSLLPTRFILAMVIILGSAILGSAVFNLTTLLRLRQSYLANRGHEIAEALESQARGSGRRNNPAFWQSLFESNYPDYSGRVAFMSLVDQNGQVLAQHGTAAAGGVRVFEEPLARPRNMRPEANPAVAGWRIRLGLYTSEADFIRRQAYLQLAISGLAVVALFVLAAKLVRTLDRFLELKVREGAETQLKSLGIMAASLAHEIRNPLGAIKGLAQLAQEDLPADHTAQPQLQTVVGEAERLEKLVTDLLDFARPREPQISEFDLGTLFSKLENMLRSRLDEAKAVLRISLEPAPIRIRSDPAALYQVLLNILINAIDAIPGNGTIALTARVNESHNSVVIQVDDSGKGLEPDAVRELFQPFVTTKPRGTGLGLAVSRQIVEKLGGSLSLENLPRGGARCTIKIPGVISGER